MFATNLSRWDRKPKYSSKFWSNNTHQFSPETIDQITFLHSLSYQVHNKEDWWDMMLSTLLSLRGGVMKSQVGCTAVRLVCDNKSIKTIMVPRPSYQTRLNQEHKLAKSKRHIIQWQSFISIIVYRLVLNNLEAAGAFSGGCRRIQPQQIHIYISSRKMIRLSTFPRASATLLAWTTPYLNKQALTFTNSLATIDISPESTSLQCSARVT